MTVKRRLSHAEYLHKIESDVTSAVMRELGPRIRDGAYGSVTLKVTLEGGAVRMIAVSPETKHQPDYLPAK